MPREPSHGTVLRAFESAKNGIPIRRHKGKEKFEACASKDVSDSKAKILSIDGVPIGIFRIGGNLHAIRNECPHNGAELCRGHVTSAYPPGPPRTFVTDHALTGRVITCPWHGRQFDIPTGQALFERGGSVLTYEVWEENGLVFVKL